MGTKPQPDVLRNERGRTPKKRLPTYDRVGARLRARRQQLGLTQWALGRKAGLRPARICAYELGTLIPGREPLARMAAALELDFPTLWRARAATLVAIDIEQHIRQLRLLERRSIATIERPINDTDDIRTRRIRPIEDVA